MEITMSKELMDALELLEKEKNISKDSLFDAIENSLITACKNNFGKAENIRVEVDRESCDFKCYADKEVVETADDVMDPNLEISLDDAKKITKKAKVGDIVPVSLNSKEFGRIATQNAKNVILQKIREEERGAIYNEYFEKEHDIVTGVVQRFIGKNISINLGRADAILNENEQVKTEVYRPTQRLRVYVLEVKNGSKGPRILVSRTHPDLVKRLNPDIGSQRLVNLMNAWRHEIKELMGGMGINSIECLRGNRLMLRGVGLSAKELEILGISHAGE